MGTISLRLNDDDYKKLQEYVSVNDLNMSSFVREAVMYKIDEDLDLDEARILNAAKRAKKEKSYDHTEVWKELGI